MHDRKTLPFSFAAVVSHRRTIVTTAIAAVFLCALSGCRPVSNSQARSPFSGLFGGSNSSNQFAQNGAPSGFGNGFNGTNTYGLAGNQNASQNAIRYPQNGSGYSNNGQGQGNVFAGANGAGVNPAASQQYNAMVAEFNKLNQRVTAYDTDNQLLNTELASSKQKLELANQYSQTLKQQLADTSARALQADSARIAAAQQLAAAQAQIRELNQLAANSPANPTRGQLSGFGNGQVPSQLPGATLNANNSLARRVSDIRIPGGQARLDGDVIRIEFPTDSLFVPGQYQIQPAQLPLLQNIVGTIRQSFPKQIIGIEAHWDDTPLNPATMSHHQLTATQALAVFDRLVVMGVPKRQMFTMAMGSNRPRHAQQLANGISPNRRIELVIYPETYDGSN